MQERDSGQGRIHIPFRNSMLTTALRDSLGGNCRTVMIANVAATADQAEETVSTCRFAQRVALISNTVSSIRSTRYQGAKPVFLPAFPRGTDHAAMVTAQGQIFRVCQKAPSMRHGDDMCEIL